MFILVALPTSLSFMASFLPLCAHPHLRVRSDGNNFPPATCPEKGRRAGFWVDLFGIGTMARGASSFGAALCARKYGKCCTVQLWTLEKSCYDGEEKLAIRGHD